jgi:(p)ppGpp synthase/HD superfamily hydrolase
MAAALHDTVEDTEITFEELENKFDSEVASLVRELQTRGLDRTEGDTCVRLTDLDLTA